MYLSARSISSYSSAVQTVEGYNFAPDAFFDDRVLCLPQTQNKNSDGSSNTNINIDSLYESEADEQIKLASESIRNQAPENILARLQAQTISVYPNPASTQIVISYESKHDGYFKLYDAMGRIILETTLSKNINKTQVQLQNIASGIYHYEVEFGNEEKSRGKLTITK
jgi:Secretion system C-terminal sorting domain